MLAAGLTIPAMAQVDVNLWKSAGVSQSYDRQTQGSVYPMTQRHDDGFIGCTWTNEDNAPFDGSSTPLRGVGYSYSTDGGQTWSWDNPSHPDYQQNRVGGIPVYWPSYAQWGANGEAILARSADAYVYNGVQIINGLVLMTRPNKGQGTWTITPVPYPAGTSPNAGYTMAWARMTTSGANHQYIHIMSPMSVPEGSPYQGYTYPVFYYRTQNGGSTWDVQGQLVPQMLGEQWDGESNYTDAISFAVQGNTVACSFIRRCYHGYVLKSPDNGNTWESIKFFDSPIGYYVDPSEYADTVYIPTQGCIALDNNGKIHVAFSVLLAMNHENQGTFYYFSHVLATFLSYWNEEMTPIDGATDFVKHKIYPLLEDYFDWDLSDDSYLYVNSTSPTWPIVGYFTPYNDHYFMIDVYGATTWTTPSYGFAGNFSFPQMTFDAENRVRLSYLGLLDGGSKNGCWLRHPFYTVSYNGGQTWTQTEHLVNFVTYIDQEFAYLTLAGFGEDKMYLMAQTDPYPGVYTAYSGQSSDHGAVSNKYTFFTVEGVPPPPPPSCDPVTNATATIEDDCKSATITWTPVSDAVEYEIRRNNVTLGKVAAPPYTDNYNFINGTTYTWGIKTICDVNESWFVSASAKADCAFCDPVTNAKAQIENCAKATITWNAVAGAKEYEIRRDGNLLDKVTTTIFVETAAFEHGSSYTWTIKAVCSKESATEVPVSATADCEVCDPVTNATAEIENCKTAIITWTAVANAKGYEIRRDGNLLGTVSTPIFSEIADFEHGKTYIWRIKTICDKTASTELSASAIADCTGINELANSVLIYPNPSNTTVTIIAKEFAKVEIYNPIGQLIETTTDNTVVVSSYNTGVYLFKVYDGNGNSVTKRVMVAR